MQAFAIILSQDVHKYRLFVICLQNYEEKRSRANILIFINKIVARLHNLQMLLLKQLLK